MFGIGKYFFGCCIPSFGMVVGVGVIVFISLVAKRRPQVGLSSSFENTYLNVLVHGGSGSGCGALTWDANISSNPPRTEYLGGSLSIHVQLGVVHNGIY